MEMETDANNFREHVHTSLYILNSRCCSFLQWTKQTQINALISKQWTVLYTPHVLIWHC